MYLIKLIADTLNMLLLFNMNMVYIDVQLICIIDFHYFHIEFDAIVLPKIYYNLFGCSTNMHYRLIITFKY